MRADDLVLVQGVRDTRAAFTRWNARPSSVLAPWLAVAILIAVALLVATWLVALGTTPDLTRLEIPGYTRPPTLADAGMILARNGLVLALHAFACLAGFIAGSAMPREASRYSGLVRTLHDRAGAAAMVFVAGATLFSLATQATILGGQAATLSAQVGLAPGMYLLCMAPHALPELTALFLPLAAWLVASRRGDRQDLLAATVVTVGIAVPVLVASCLIELELAPRMLAAVTG